MRDDEEERNSRRENEEIAIKKKGEYEGQVVIWKRYARIQYSSQEIS